MNIIIFIALWLVCGVLGVRIANQMLFNKYGDVLTWEQCTIPWSDPLAIFTVVFGPLGAIGAILGVKAGTEDR